MNYFYVVVHYYSAWSGNHWQNFIFPAKNAAAAERVVYELVPTFNRADIVRVTVKKSEEPLDG